MHCVYSAQRCKCVNHNVMLRDNNHSPVGCGVGGAGCSRMHGAPRHGDIISSNGRKAPRSVSTRSTGSAAARRGRAVQCNVRRAPVSPACWLRAMLHLGGRTRLHRTNHVSFSSGSAVHRCNSSGCMPNSGCDAMRVVCLWVLPFARGRCVGACLVLAIINAQPFSPVDQLKVPPTA